jgi:hypothetical protein
MIIPRYAVIPSFVFRSNSDDVTALWEPTVMAVTSPADLLCSSKFRLKLQNDTLRVKPPKYSGVYITIYSTLIRIFPLAA